MRFCLRDILGALCWATLFAAAGCARPEPKATNICDTPFHVAAQATAREMRVGTGALLASRFASLEDFKRVVQVTYSSTGPVGDTTATTTVRLCYCSNGVPLESELTSGVSQDDLSAARDSGYWAIAELLAQAPLVGRYKPELDNVYLLGRRLPRIYGEGDASFYDVAEAFVEHINWAYVPAMSARDTSEKGYLNSFNHITAQAFMTAMYGEELADLVADLHERKNMRALTNGIFNVNQLVNANNNPVENYVDIINNEWGQEIGKRIKARFGIRHRSDWSPEMTALVLNELQTYFMWAFEIQMHPFRPEDGLVREFAEKLMIVANLS